MNSESCNYSETHRVLQHSLRLDPTPHSIPKVTEVKVSCVPVFIHSESISQTKTTLLTNASLLRFRIIILIKLMELGPIFKCNYGETVHYPTTRENSVQFTIIGKTLLEPCGIFRIENETVRSRITQLSFESKLFLRLHTLWQRLHYYNLSNQDSYRWKTRVNPPSYHLL